MPEQYNRKDIGAGVYLVASTARGCGNPPPNHNPLWWWLLSFFP